MTISYMITAAPEQLATLQKALDEIGIPFDPNDSMLAIPDNPVEESIFPGDRLEELMEAANRYVELQGRPGMPEIRQDHWNLSVQARYDFLELMVNHVDREGDRINSISQEAWRKFMEKHPEAARVSSGRNTQGLGQMRPEGDSCVTLLADAQGKQVQYVSTPPSFGCNQAEAAVRVQKLTQVYCAICEAYVETPPAPTGRQPDPQTLLEDHLREHREGKFDR